MAWPSAGDHTPAEHQWLTGGGEMAKVIAALDWSRTPLGPLESWPQSLRTTVSLCLASNFPINIIWGDDHCQIYNDGYRVVCGAVHPRAVGEDYRVTWASAWPAIGEPFERALAGETTYLENQRMFLERNGYPEETFFTFSLSPIRDEAGKVVGLFHPVTETTVTMLAERRTRALRDIADRAGRARVFDEACDLLLGTLRTYELDLPFALLYVTNGDGTRAHLRGACGTMAAGPLAPEELTIAGADARLGWPLTATHDGRITPVADVQARFGAVAAGPYDEPIRTAFVLPVRVAGVEAAIGFLVVGASPRLPLDENYRAFMEMLGAAASAALGGARASEAERRRAEALAEIDRAKTSFFSNVSHEFRTPLTLLLGPVEDLLRGRHGELCEGTRRELEVVHRNGLRLLKLVNALLEFSRIEAGRVEARFERTDLPALTGDLASAFRSAIERAGLRFVVDLQPFEETVLVDLDMWEKIVLNLVSNAFKFTTAGEIRVTLRRVETFAELCVHDTGIGIAPDEIGRVFQRFHRVQGAIGRTHEGSGIGLALVHDLAHLLGGSVHVESVHGQGSTFSVRIPVARAPGAAAPIAHELQRTRDPERECQTERAFVEEAERWLPDPEPGDARGDARSDAGSNPGSDAGVAAGTKPAQGPRPRILVVDDNADMRSYVRRLLADYQVTAVANGREALDAARDSPPDLVLSDVMMPEMDGEELVKRLRADASLRAVPVILLSARAGEEATASGLEVGADDYLTKPFASRELLARVRTHLTMASLRQRAAEQESLALHLAQQQTWLEAVLDRMPVPMLVIDAVTGELAFANRAADRLAGGRFPACLDVLAHGSASRLEGTGDDLVDDADSPVSRLRASARVRDVEAEWLTPAGRFDVVIDSDSIPAVGAQPARKIVALRDITRLKQVERALKASLGVRDEFLAIASHELRTPLTTLRMQVQFAERSFLKAPDRPLPPERLGKMLHVMSGGVDRLTALVDDLLDVARIRSGQLSLKLSPVDLVALVRDALERMSPQLVHAGCAVSFAAPPQVIGRWDARRVEQVLTNLLVNAMKYAPRTPLRVTVTEDREAARLEVRDFGAGIPEAQRDSIFDRFDRAGASRNAGGLGLGLFISRQLVRAHAGTIAVEGPPGGGASFVVLLPRNGGDALATAGGVPAEALR